MQLPKFARLNRGWSLCDLAARTGLTHSVLCQIERGRVNPTNQEIERISDALSFDPARFFTHVSAEPLGDGAEFRDSQREERLTQSER
jgi:transcriptional regulator with XRE-family HTH domain